MIIIWLDVVPGWIGAFLILLAFWLLTHKAVHSHSYTYLGLNLAGGILLLYEAWLRRSHPSIALNFIWIIVAIYGIGWAHKKKDIKFKR